MRINRKQQNTYHYLCQRAVLSGAILPIVQNKKHRFRELCPPFALCITRGQLLIAGEKFRRWIPRTSLPARLR